MSEQFLVKKTSYDSHNYSGNQFESSIDKSSSKITKGNKIGDEKMKKKPLIKRYFVVKEDNNDCI